ncbi:unnamed protein product [Prorocentrum cordatum]|uniref:Reverse transcriptase domain-containing protein n=1 Tax=Prorocentrum cordatum TaxID=2364126 RepID=A0ABN9T3I1_9DINO|nr:unnamed protein product [Polarella glacialis]
MPVRYCRNQPFCKLSMLFFPYWNKVVGRLIPQQFGIFVGARPRTQALDIAHALQLVVEKGLDDCSNATLAQCDAQTYFDELRALRICRWLVTRGCSPEDVACLVRAQMVPRVIPHAGGSAVPIVNRSKRGLTGSRTALMLARILVEEVMNDRAESWKTWGFRCDESRLRAASCIDNVFACSNTPE